MIISVARFGVCRKISLCGPLCHLCASVVNLFSSNFTTETQSITEFEVSTESGSDRVAADFQDCYPVATALGTDSTTVVLQIKTPLDFRRRSLNAANTRRKPLKRFGEFLMVPSVTRLKPGVNEND